MNKTMNNTLAVIGGIGAGAAVMYFLDPDRGSTRRALVRDKALALKNDASFAIAGKAKDLKNRAQGLAHEAKGFLAGANAETGKNEGTRSVAAQDSGKSPVNNFTQGKVAIG